MQTFINNYIIQLLNRVKDEYFKEQILELLDYAKFTNLSSIILALEVLVTCAVINPENFQFIYALLKEPNSHFNYSNSPWILLSLLYGNDELAANLLTSLYNSSEPYFAEAKTYDKDLKTLLDASHNQEHLAKIDTQIKSLQIPPYVDLPF